MAAPTQQPAPAPLCDTSDMVIVHRYFRHTFRDAPGLVRGVAPGDVHRAAVVGEHVADLVASLHNHHHTEDVVLWDTLEQRSPACALHVGLMRSQHAEVAVLLDQVTEALPAWRAGAGESERDAVAEPVDRIRIALNAHLGAEEETILPVAATTMTQQEWGRLEKVASAGVPMSKQLVMLGWMIDALGPDDGRVRPEGSPTALQAPVGGLRRPALRGAQAPRLRTLTPPRRTARRPPVRNQMADGGAQRERTARTVRSSRGWTPATVATSMFSIAGSG